MGPDLAVLRWLVSNTKGRELMGGQCCPHCECLIECGHKALGCPVRPAGLLCGVMNKEGTAYGGWRRRMALVMCVVLSHRPCFVIIGFFWFSQTAVC